MSTVRVVPLTLSVTLLMVRSPYSWTGLAHYIGEKLVTESKIGLCLCLVICFRCRKEWSDPRLPSREDYFAKSERSRFHEQSGKAISTRMLWTQRSAF